MAKLRVLSGKQVCKILSMHGFVFVRQRGSHVMMRKVFPTYAITIPVPKHKEVIIGTLISIINESGIPRSEFE